MFTRPTTVTAVLAFLLSAAVSQADTLTPTAVLSSSDFSGGTASINLINSSGLTDVGGDGDDANDTHNNVGNAFTMWLSANSSTDGDENDESLIFDLGGLFDVTAALVWNHNQSGGFSKLGVDTMDVSATATGTTTGDASGFTGTTGVNLTQAGEGAEAAQSVVLSFTGVRFIKFDNFVNFETTSGGPDTTYAGTQGISEVRFVGTEHVVVPAPAALPAGLALLVGLVSYRRR